MNAPVHTRVWKQSEIAAQEAEQFAVLLAKQGKLFQRTGARDDWRNHFLDSLVSFVAQQERDLQDAIEEGGDEHIHETQRTFFEQTRGLAVVR